MKKRTVKDRVCDILSSNPDATGKEVLAKLKKKYPKENFNEGTVFVAFSHARSDLGLSGKKRKASAKLSTDPLHAAHKFVSEVGDPHTAISAVKQLMKLQVR